MVKAGKVKAMKQRMNQIKIRKAKGNPDKRKRLRKDLGVPDMSILANVYFFFIYIFYFFVLFSSLFLKKKKIFFNSFSFFLFFFFFPHFFHHFESMYKHRNSIDVLNCNKKKKLSANFNAKKKTRKSWKSNVHFLKHSERRKSADVRR